MMECIDRRQSQQLRGLPHAEWLVKVPEAASRASDDMARAKEAQTRLFPRKLPVLETLAYGGVCIQAGEVGGDSYDFLDLGRGYLGLTIADAAGKGLAAALLMASLQANLRSQCILAIDDVGSLLRAVNRLMCDNTPEGSYTTLFFAEYSDEGQRLRYVNCGHLPALLMHSDGAVDHLESTATVLGLHEDWECTVEEVRLCHGDTLLLYTDGVTEAINQDGEEFGERSLVELLRVHRLLPPSALLRCILNGLQHFAGNRFQDDMTLVAARCVGQ